MGTINASVTNVTTPVLIWDVRRSPLYRTSVKYEGDFACADGALKHGFGPILPMVDGRYVCRAGISDSPHHQEPIGDYGDYLIEDRVAYIAFGGRQALAVQDLRKMGARDER